MSTQPTQDPSPSGPILIPSGVLAFRSITTLISLIQQQPFGHPPDGNPTEEKAAQDLILSVAFSILAALEHEVVAVAAKRNVGELKVTVCSNLAHDKGRRLMQQFMDHVQHATTSFIRVFSRNERWNDPPICEISEFPTVIPTSSPNGLMENSTAEGLQRYIEQLCEDKAMETEPRLHLPLHKHLEVLRQLLSVKMENVLTTKYMMRYIVATSYVKMNHRMQRTSPGYLDTLASVSLSNLDPVGQPIDGSNVKDRDFLIYLASLPSDWQLKYPLLYALGTKAEADLLQSFQLYTDDTREQFHKLFITCLQQFATGLQELVNIRKPQKGRSRDAECGTQNNFEYYTVSVMRHGYCLRKLIRTHALQMHLHAILSSRYKEPSLACTPTPMPTVDDNPTVPSQEDGSQDIEPLLADTSIPEFVKPYRDWLKLIIAEFDAVHVLVSEFVEKHQQSIPISIQVVEPSPAGKASLSWEGLFRPSSSPYIQQPGDITNEMLLHFLTNIKSALPRAWSLLGDLEGFWRAYDVTKMEDMIKKTKNELEKHQKRAKEQCGQGEHWRSWLVTGRSLPLMPGWPLMLNDLVTMLGSWKDDQSPEHGMEITETLQSLRKSANFFQNIANTERGKAWQGRTHCEAYLASFIAVHTRKSIETMKGYEGALAATKDVENIIGVSRRCCATCAFFLKLLEHEKGPILTRGSHNTVSPCSLPTWLPADIVSAMNYEFGKMLKLELIRLLKEPDSLRRRAKSTGSSGRSSDGEEGRLTPNVDFSKEAKSMPM